MDPIDWDACYAEYCRYWAQVGSVLNPAKEFEPSQAAVDRLTQPTHDDARWVIEALRQHDEPPAGRQWFVAVLLQPSHAVADVFFVALLDAAIDEVDPSYNRQFVEPCMRSFGPRRVNEYLLSVVASGTDFRKAGAVNALYWARVLAFPAAAPSLDALEDVWERKNRLLLETFVANSNVDVRRSIIPSLDLDPLTYPESHRPLVAQAIDIARSHEDDYIRHRVRVQLGDASEGLAPLPHRDQGTTSA